MNREIVLKWLEVVDAYKPGESLFLATENRDHSKLMVKQFKEELKILAEIDPVKANKLGVATAVKDGKYWVEVKRTMGSSLVGFKKTAKGVERTSIEDPERRRRLLLMQDDGMTLVEVEEIEDDLTPEEKEMFR
jgi:hypothetical protein